MNTNKLKRDNHSKAVLNTDIDSYKKHRYEEYKNRQLNAKLIEIEQMKSDINDIKDMLTLLLNGKQNNG